MTLLTLGKRLRRETLAKPRYLPIPGSKVGQTWHFLRKVQNGRDQAGQLLVCALRPAAAPLSQLYLHCESCWI